jgi:acyl-CoA synthetase (AMP-forming)/AMP-acid ligase II
VSVLDGLVPAQVLRTPLVAHLLARAESESPAFTCLGDGSATRTLTWADLTRRVRVVAERIAALTAPGELVALFARQDLDYVVGFLATLYAGRVAVPLPAPERRAHRERLVTALGDCGAKLWLTCRDLADPAREQAVHLPPGFAGALVLEEIQDGDSDLLPARVAPDDPAYLQYTSGSTDRPAAAIITHRALSASCWQVSKAYGVDSSVTCAGWIPMFHDMGLIQLLCVPVYTGARSVHLPPLEFVRAPIRWLRQMSDYPNVFTAAPNFAFDLAVEATSADDRAGLDLSGVRVALNGSEPVQAGTIRAFAEAFAPYGFPPEAHRPSYGLAEATVYVTSAGQEGPTSTSFDRAALCAGRAVAAAGPADRVQEVVAVGSPVGQLVRIVDPDRRSLRCDDEIGEVWVHGPHLAAGYWGQPERAAETFGARLLDAGELPRDGWLRTGDLGVVHAGQLYITGRIKDLIIVDGVNHYPQDIERTVSAAHRCIRRGRVAAFGVPAADGEAAVVVAEQEHGVGEVDHDEVERAVRRVVAARHELSLHDFRLLPPGTVPRTSSGKVARSAARARWREATARSEGE